MTDACRLCGQVRSLKDSHILPAFVFRWKRESAGGSPLRNTKQPNLRVQDGLKTPFLCEECEELFSKDEREFANKIFYPYAQDRAAQRFYGPWLLRFCASVSWRILRFSMEHESFASLKGTESEHHCREAELTWREFLLGQRPHPGHFRQQILPFDLLGSGGQGASSNINRFLTRSIQLDICHGPGDTFTFGKLGPIGIFGTIRQRPGSWKGTQVQANQGMVGGAREYVLPRALWDYLNDKARETAAAMAAISPKQHEIINKSLLKNADAYVRSDAFRAMQADVAQFGNEAFTKVANQADSNNGSRTNSGSDKNVGA